jgi:hypothetical protein
MKDRSARLFSKADFGAKCSEGPLPALSDAGKLSELRVFEDVTSGGSGRSLARAALRLEGLLLRR